MRSNVSSASSVAAHGRRVIAVVLLNRHEEELHVEVEVKARVQEAYNQVCQHLGLRETEYFGLANLIGECFYKKDSQLHHIYLHTV